MSELKRKTAQFWREELNVMVRRMKMAAVSTAALLLLCSLVSSTVSQDKCDRAEVGQNTILSLTYKLAPSDGLKWLHEGIPCVALRATKFIIGSKDDITKNGSLKLTNLQKSNKGTYKVQVHDQAGIFQFESHTTLCVFEKVPKPAVDITCIGFGVIFTCNIGTHQAQDFSFKWLQGKKVMGSEKTLTLKQSFEQEAADLFQCQVSNSINNELSQPVKHSCKTPPAETDSIFPEKILGIEFWIMATVLGGGGGLALLLIVIAIVCFTRARRRRRHQFKEEEELHLDWAHQQQQQQQQQQHNHPHRHQQPGHTEPGHTGPRQHRCNPSRDPQHPRGSDPAGTNPRHPRPHPRTPARGSNAADKGKEGQRPPLPQPRKGNPRTDRV